jgi:hypothetical protein
VKLCIRDVAACVRSVFHSFKQLWKLYHVQCKLLAAYVSLQPPECWIRKLATYMLCTSAMQSIYDSQLNMPCVYAWVSIETGLFYVGSSKNFKQRC